MAPRNEQLVASNCNGIWPVAPPSPAELPNGQYIAAYCGAERRQWFGQDKIRIVYEIVEPRACAGVQVFLFSTLPKRASQRHKYYDLWVRANGGLPLRNDRMSPKVFRGYWKVQITWNAPNAGGHPMPLVTELIERVAGGN